MSSSGCRLRSEHCGRRKAYTPRTTAGCRLGALWRFALAHTQMHSQNCSRTNDRKPGCIRALRLLASSGRAADPQQSLVGQKPRREEQMAPRQAQHAQPKGRRIRSDCLPDPGCGSEAGLPQSGQAEQPIGHRVVSLDSGKAAPDLRWQRQGNQPGARADPAKIGQHRFHSHIRCNADIPAVAQQPSA